MEVKEINKAMRSTGKDDWETPQELFDQLNEKYHFTLDPCATPQNAKCPNFFTEEQNGLIQNWKGHTVFCNPPYSKKGKQDEWVKKAYEESRDPSTTVVMLIPARTGANRFHDYILPHGKIEFLRGRLKFAGAKNSAPFDSMIVVFGGE